MPSQKVISLCGPYCNGKCSKLSLRFLPSFLSFFGCLMMLSPIHAYNRPGCPSWPSMQQWQQELGSRLSTNNSLVPNVVAYDLTSYTNQCSPWGSNPFSLAADSWCMQSPDCAFQYCDTDNQVYQDPSYMVVARTADDLTAALEFASKYDVAVSVKTSGHSYQGSSQVQDSLLISMAQFSKQVDLPATTTVDSCGNAATTIGIHGGALWDDVLEAVGPNYHMVTGGCRSVSAIGGWLQGVGMSYTSRKYGLGIDQAVRFQVVLADGTQAVADACTNPDLFWALRGGGGGTFGIVTHVDYRVYNTTPITVLEWLFDTGTVVNAQRSDLLELWLNYWIGASINLDERWSGFFNAGGVHLTFTGVQQDARDAFATSFIDWYDAEFAPQANTTPGLNIGPPYTWQASSWYEYKGGAAGYRNPTGTVQTGSDYVGFAFHFGARLVPRSFLDSNSQDLVQFLVQMAQGGTLSYVNYFLGGNTNLISADATAVHPAMRQSIYHIALQGDQTVHDQLRSLLPNNITGVSFNHHNVLEPDWHNALWGYHYSRLLALKDIYDPEHRFNCWHCVGYQGPDPEDPSYTEPACPAYTGTAVPSASNINPPSPSAAPPAPITGTTQPVVSPSTSTGNTQSPTIKPLSTPVISTAVPSKKPSHHPAATPRPPPTSHPSYHPSRSPIGNPGPPSTNPLGSNTQSPVQEPSQGPSHQPAAGTSRPVLTSTEKPSGGPSGIPTEEPILITSKPIHKPSQRPSSSPTAQGNSLSPSQNPTAKMAPSGSGGKPVAKPSAASRFPSSFPTSSVVPSGQGTSGESSVSPSSQAQGQPSPTSVGTLVQTSFPSLKIYLAGVSNLDASAQAAFEMATQSWYDSIYGSSSSGRRLQLRVADFSTEVGFVSQTADGTGNTVQYNQTLSYRKLPRDQRTPSDILLNPFANQNLYSDYTERLKYSDAAFQSLEGYDVGRPVVPVTAPNSGASSKSSTLGVGAIAGIASAGAVVLALLVFVGYRRARNNDEKEPGIELEHSRATPVSAPPRPIQSDTSSLLGPTRIRSDLMDQTEIEPPMSEYEFARAISGSTAGFSVVSSITGAEGPRPKAGESTVVTQANSNGSPFGKDFDPEELTEEILHIIAPPGKLGVVIDTPDEGPPVVHRVKKGSVLTGRLLKGDRLLSINDVVVTGLTALDISKLMKKAEDSERKMTVIRNYTVKESSGDA